MDMNDKRYNELYVAHFDEQRTKLAGYGAATIRDQVREVSFSDSIMEPKTLTRADCQVSVHTDTLVKVVQVESASGAMTAAVRGRPDVMYIKAGRFEVGFRQLMTLRYEKHKMELEAYDFDIVGSIKTKMPLDIAEVKDRNSLNLFEAAVQMGQKDANGLAIGAATKFTDTQACTAYNIVHGTCIEKSKIKSISVIQGSSAGSAAAGVTDTFSALLEKDDLVKLNKLFPGDGVGRGGRLECVMRLISKTDLEDLGNWSLSQVGDDIVKQTTTDGFKGKSVVGMRWITTVKTDVLRPGNIFAFCAEEYLGGTFQYGSMEMEADKKHDMFSFEAWCYQGQYIGLPWGVRKLELYAGASDTMASGSTDNAALLARYAPLAEDRLHRQNTLVYEGGVIPNIQNF